MGEKLIDQHMCTYLCPCLSKEEWLTTDEGIKIRRIDPEFVYGNLHEDKLNLHNRTNQNKTGYIPLVFNDTVGYETFKECFDTYKANIEGDFNELSKEFDIDYVSNDKNEIIKHALRNDIEMLDLDLF